MAVNCYAEQDFDMIDLRTTCYALYRMNDDRANTQVHDATGTTVAGTNHAGTADRNTNLLSDTGKINEGFTLNGTTDFIDTGNWGTPMGALLEEFWISVWVKTTEGSTAMCILGSINASGTLLIIQINESNQNGGIDVKVIDDDDEAGLTALTAATDITDGSFHHLVIYVKKSTATVNIWLDNTAVSVSYDDEDTGVNFAATFANNLGIGACLGAGGDTTHFDGTLDMLGIFSGVPTAGEISMLWNSGAGTESLTDSTLSEACMGLWKMNDDTTSSTVTDDSGNEHDGDLYRGGTPRNTDQASTAGHINEAFTMVRASADNVKILDHADLRPANISVVLWTKLTTVGIGFRFASKRDATLVQWEVLGLAGNQIYVTFRINGTDRSTTSSAVLATGSYSLIIATYDGNVIQIFHKNVSVGTDSRWSGDLNTTQPANVFFANRYEQLVAYGMNGELDICAVFDRALTEAERDFLWRSGVGIEQLFAKTPLISSYGGAGKLVS